MLDRRFFLDFRQKCKDGSRSESVSFLPGPDSLTPDPKQWLLPKESKFREIKGTTKIFAISVENGIFGNKRKLNL